MFYVFLCLFINKHAHFCMFVYLACMFASCITRVGNTPPRFHGFDFFQPAGHAKQPGGGFISPTPGSLRRASRSSHFEIWASQKPPFSTGFIRFFDMAESHSVYSEKPNAFWMLFGPKTRKWLQKYQ